MSVVLAEPSGSSPLARGLPADGAVNDVKTRIIPARAGFTHDFRDEEGGRRDHPRSRGVYANVDVTSLAAAGSSPLARGLPGNPPDTCKTSWIIPARAGFTKVRVILQRIRRDHPRSRGVYSFARLAWRTCAGSSPLARGLRILELRVGNTYGIIPARAGFTRKSVREKISSTDHPRSRGVYTGCIN